MADKKTIKVKLVKSPIGCKQSHRDTVRGLGLRRLNSVRELQDTPAVRGMINKISYLVQVLELAHEDHMQLNTIKPAAGAKKATPPRRSRHRLGPGQDGGSRPQGPEIARRRFSQGWLRRRPDAAAASPAQARLQVGAAEVQRRNHAGRPASARRWTRSTC